MDNSGLFQNGFDLLCEEFEEYVILAEEKRFPDSLYAYDEFGHRITVFHIDEVRDLSVFVHENEGGEDYLVVVGFFDQETDGIAPLAPPLSAVPIDAVRELISSGIDYFADNPF